MGESKRKRAALRRLPELSLEEHAMDLRVRVASEFRRTGRVIHRFEAVTEKGDVFHVDAGWHNDHERAMFPNSLKDAFRRRGVQRYLFATESWRGSGKTDIRPSADPDRTEHVDITAVERGSRLFHSAEIKRADGVIGDWTTCDEFKGWLGELLDDVDSDGGDEQPSADVTRFVSQRGEPLSADDAEKNPALQTRVQATRNLISEIEQTLQELYRPGEDWAVFSALVEIVRPFLGASKEGLLRHAAQTLRDNPDRFPITPSVPSPEPDEVSAVIEKHAFRYCDRVGDMLVGQEVEVVFNAVFNVMTNGGVSLMGGPGYADFLEQTNWGKTEEH